MLSVWLVVAIFAYGFLPQTLAFSFSVSPQSPSQCGETTVTWTGGQPPFRLLVIPARSPPQTHNVPDNAFGQNAGSYSFTMNLTSSTQLLFAMSDATGLTAGGISQAMTVGSGPTTCNPGTRSADFFFSVTGDLAECKSYSFTGFEGAIQPITIHGFIPGGESFTLQPPQGSSWSWTNNRRAGTSIMFWMTDSQGRNGGTTSLLTVASSNDQSCLVASQTTTSTPPPGHSSSPTSSGGPSQTSSSPSGSDGKSGVNKTAAIVGGTLGGVLILVGLALFFAWRKVKANRERVGLQAGPTSNSLGEPKTSRIVPPRPGVSPFVLAPPVQTSIPYHPDLDHQSYASGSGHYHRDSVGHTGFLGTGPLFQHSSSSMSSHTPLLSAPVPVSSVPASPPMSSSRSTYLTGSDNTDLPPSYVQDPYPSGATQASSAVLRSDRKQ